MKLITFLFILTLPTIALAHNGNDDKFIIRMNNNGFEPRELTVGEGDNVVFINDDDTDRWPASNLHPTHGIYPEFDPEKHIKPGESWSFTFNKPGLWKMHDHLIPSMTGAITVLEGKDESASTTETLDKPQAKNSFWSRIKSFFSRLFGKD